MTRYSPRVWRRSVVRGYKALALLALNTLVVLVFINLAAAALLAVYRGLLAPEPGPLRYDREKLARVYPHRTQGEIEALLTEIWSREYVYAPFVQHREGAMRGRFVNVDRHGFRHSAEQGPWPPDELDFSIFVFGGSTTYGYGVADHETVPSRLQQVLAEHGCHRARVYNFGRGNYYSEQERILLESLMAAGAVPDVVLFIDGLNEWKAAPKFTGRLEYLLAETSGQLVRRASKSLPAVELVRTLRADLRRTDAADAASEITDSDRELAKAAVDRWVRSKKMIEAVARELGVAALFVWQPVPSFAYGLEHHLFAGESAEALARHRALRYGYGLMDDSRSVDPGLERSGNFLWLADIQRDRKEPLYVDAAHYTAAFSEEIARRIASFVTATAPCAGGGSGADSSATQQIQALAAAQ